MITERDMDVLRAVAKYYVLSRAHIQRLHFPNDKTGRATRRRLQTLVSANLLNRTRTPVFNPNGGSPWPAYYPSRAGIECLADYYQDEQFLAACVRSPEPYHLHHLLAITETHLALDQAIAAQDAVRLEGWLNEFDVVNPQETTPERRYRLYTLLREHPRLICAPDAAFLLALGQLRKVFYLEQDRGTTGTRQVAARKTPGYAELAGRREHTRHFPQATVDSFTALLVTTTPRRRDALRKAMHEKPGAELWKFAAQTEVTFQSILCEPIFYPCQGDPVPLVKTSAISSSQHTQPTTT